MSSMNLPSTHDVLDAAEHLLSGARLLIEDFDWKHYEQLREAIGNGSRWRVSYDHGRLEILSPSPRHDKFGALIDLVVFVFMEVHDLDLESYGHATWKSKAIEVGVEPDCCYFIRKAHRVVGKLDFNMAVDPPPDVAVEVDLTRSSFKKLSIYAALGVPEVWRFHGNAFTFHALEGGRYSELQASRIVPQLTGAIMVEAIEDCVLHGQTKALKAFRRRLLATK